MGFLDRLRFRSKKTVSMEEALQKEQAELAKKEGEILDYAYNSAINVCDSLQELRDMLAELSKKEVKEERLRGQKALVDRFCSVGGEQITTLVLPEKDIAETKNFIEKSLQLTKELGRLSPKEALRIKFFFEEDFAQISQKIKNIETISSKAAEKLSSIENHGELQRTAGEIKKLGAEEESLKKQLAALGAALKEKERLINETGKQLLTAENSIKGCEENEKDIAKKERTLMLLKQEIDSYLSVSRLLKRLKHDNKLNSELLDKYIQSPSVALESDEALRICDFITEALTLPIEDKKLIEKARHIEKNRLGQMRSNLVKTTGAIDNEKQKINQQLAPLKHEKDKLASRKSYMEKEAEEMNKKTAETEKKMNSCKKSIAELETKRKILLEGVLGVEINE